MDIIEFFSNTREELQVYPDTAAAKHQWPKCRYLHYLYYNNINILYQKPQKMLRISSTAFSHYILNNRKQIDVRSNLPFSTTDRD